MSWEDNQRITQANGPLCMSCQKRRATGFVMVGKFKNIKKYRCDVCRPGVPGGGISMLTRKEKA